MVNTRYDAIPSRALETAKTAILDGLGVAVAGGTEESAQIAGKLVREERAPEETTIYGQRSKSSALEAAFVNGTATHAHGFDHSFVAGGQPTSADYCGSFRSRRGGDALLSLVPEVHVANPPSLVIRRRWCKPKAHITGMFSPFQREKPQN